MADAAAAVAELLKLRPGLTAQKLMEESTLCSSHPAFRREFRRIIERRTKGRAAGEPGPTLDHAAAQLAMCWGVALAPGCSEPFPE